VASTWVLFLAKKIQINNNHYIWFLFFSFRNNNFFDFYYKTQKLLFILRNILKITNLKIMIKWIDFPKRITMVFTFSAYVEPKWVIFWSRPLGTVAVTWSVVPPPSARFRNAGMCGVCRVNGNAFEINKIWNLKQSLIVEALDYRVFLFFLICLTEFVRASNSIMKNNKRKRKQAWNMKNSFSKIPTVQRGLWWQKTV